ncbi:MAG TPA: hypothetical protein VE781_05760 [Kineosporiaceae bacterium]|jgi:hypothetical protein|nr:hypothetical protein [Kineosporiaceae bacterium]
MATLEMVPLRSMMPHTGRVTLRYALPTVRIDVPVDTRAAALPRIATTPQVEQEPIEAELETTARKGGEAR